MSNQESAAKSSHFAVVILWVVILGGITWFFGYLLNNLHNPNQRVISTLNNGASEVRLKQNNRGHYLAKGKINDHEVVFLLDTGATHLSIPKPIADKLNLKEGVSIPVNTANGSIIVQTTRLKTVSLGNITLQNIIANINPHMQGDEILLGMSFLKHLELIQRGNVLTIRVPQS